MDEKYETTTSREALITKLKEVWKELEDSNFDQVEGFILTLVKKEGRDAIVGNTSANMGGDIPCLIEMIAAAVNGVARSIANDSVGIGPVVNTDMAVMFVMAKVLEAIQDHDEPEVFNTRRLDKTEIKLNLDKDFMDEIQAMLNAGKG